MKHALDLAARLGGWQLAGSWTHSGDVANVDFINLAQFDELQVIIQEVTSSGSSRRTLRVSSTNGVTFHATSGDYVGTDANGVPSNTTSLPFHTTNATAGRSGTMIISGLRLTTLKPITMLTRGLSAWFTLAVTVNAIRILMEDGSNLTGGSIYVFGR